MTASPAYLRKKKAEWNDEQADYVERNVTLNCIDRNWTKHIDTMAHLREGIGLRSYAQTNPLQDYVNEGYSLFRDMNNNISVDCAFNLMNVKIVKKPEEPAPAEAQPAQGEPAPAPEQPDPEQPAQEAQPEAKPEEEPKPQE